MIMFSRYFSAIAAAALVATTAFAQSGAPPTEDDADVAVQPEAIKALDDMAAFLRTLKEFRLTAVTTRDDVLDDGQKVQIAGQAVYEVRVPDRMKIEVETDMRHRVYYYDGKTVTQYAPSLDSYAIFDAPDTIARTIDVAQEKYGVELPLADLFFWGTERSNVKSLSSAFFVGESRVGTDTCGHYAYRAEGADFQVWTRTSGDPLPCRLVITTTDSEARPEFSATLIWDLSPDFGDSMFSFVPPPGASRIEQQAADSEN